MSVNPLRPRLVIKNISAYDVNLFGRVKIRPGDSVDVYDKLEYNEFGSLTTTVLREFEAPSGEIYRLWKTQNRIQIIEFINPNYQGAGLGADAIQTSNSYFEGAVLGYESGELKWITGGGGGGGVTSVTASLPLSSSGGATPAISLGTVGVAKGGTGQTSLTANAVVLGNGALAVQTVAPGTSGNVLTSDGTTWSSAPSSATPPGGGVGDLQINDGVGGFAGSTDLSFGAQTLEVNNTVRVTDGGNTLTVQPTFIGSDAATLTLDAASTVQVGGVAGVSVGGVYSLPAADGLTGQVMTTNGAGVSTWATPAGGGGITGAGVTTDAVPTSILSVTPVASTTTVYEAKIAGRKQGASEAISTGIAATYIESGGAVTIVGSEQLWIHETTPAAVSAVLQVVGSDVEVVVTGEAPIGPVFTAPVVPPVPSGTTWTVGTLGGENYPDVAAALASGSVVDGDLLSLSAQVFTVAATIAVNKQVTIRGQGIASTILQTAATGADPVTVMDVSVSNVTIQDLTIKQRRTTNTTIENCVTISAGAASSGHYLESVRIETMELGVTVQSDGWQINNCQLLYAGATNQTSYLVIVYRSVGSGIVANTQVGHGVSTTSRSFLIRANGGANLLGGYLRFGNITLLPGQVSTFQFINCDSFSESGNLSLVVDSSSVNEQSAFIVFNVDKPNLLNFFDYIALSSNTIAGTHGGSPIGNKGAFAIDGTGAGPQPMGTTQFFADSNTVGVTSFRAGWSTILDTAAGYSASQLALAGWDSVYYSGTPNLPIVAPVAAVWDWTVTVTKQEAP